MHGQGTFSVALRRLPFFSVVFGGFQHRPCSSLVRFIPKLFILSGAVMKRIAFRISLLGCSLLVYRTTVDFRILILCHADSPHLFISSARVFMGLWGFST